MPGRVALVVAVRPCHAFACFAASYAAPAFLALGEPQGGSVDVDYLQDVPPGLTTDIQLRFDDFAYAVPPVFYRWTLAHHADGSGPLLPWQAVPLRDVSAARAREQGQSSPVNVIATAAVNMSLFDNQVVYAVVQGFAADGSLGLAAAAAQASAPLPPAFYVGVLDVTAETASAQSADSATDLPFTASETSLGATWVEQWAWYQADYFDWSVGTVRAFDPDCASNAPASSTLSCGRTFDRFAAATGALVEEWRHILLLHSRWPGHPEWL
jgi:hypothetical protein